MLKVRVDRGWERSNRERNIGRITYSAIVALTTLQAVGIVELKVGCRSVGNRGLQTDCMLGLVVIGVLSLGRRAQRNNVAAAVADKERSSLTECLVGGLVGVAGLDGALHRIKVDAYVGSEAGVLAEKVLAGVACEIATLLG
jgi:hypothetical protein